MHAFVLGWPDDGIARFPALGRGGTVRRVTLLGDPAPLSFRQTAAALVVTLP